MGTTKEDILTTVLRLFAQDGYEAVSVSSIAGELGMTKGALYKHYKNKRDIFNSIVEKMYRLDAERSQAYEVPEEEFSANASAYEGVSLESVRNFAIAQFKCWTCDDFASRFRKMLTLEQYRDPEMAELYNNCIAAGPVAYMADIIHGVAYWADLVSACEGAEVVSVEEMEGNEELWADWLAQDNEYAANDRKSMDAGAGKYLNFVAIVFRKR